ncbi:hypothetical protein TRFO_34610 [Tritrichomonas foetus]|uniref:Uncharacterized protein n=1 Tax=Tritrichomonas foetus TaxID=1144522 RepID=A0A1J4JIH9_9EUKA|nr:hypothetical protein TRFO_34610 [Tritrichomonas foetus]|eukprot:OHS99000.1 hypothetical protein TRFO_34610 [Tritrichomonas foetus]
MKCYIKTCRLKLMNENHEALLIKLETVQNLLQQRNADCESYMKRNAELERIVQQSQNDEPDIQDLQMNQITVLQDHLKSLIEIKDILEEKYFKMKAKKNKYKEKFLLANESQKTFPQRTFSEVESKNEQLRKEIVELQNSNKLFKKDYEKEKIRANSYHEKFNKCEEDLVKWQNLAEDKIQILNRKLKEAREGKTDTEQLVNAKKEIESIQTENNLLKQTIESLEAAAQEITNSQADFINSLESVLGCQSLEKIVETVKLLAPLKIENEKLKMEISKLEILGTVDQNDAYSTIVDALKQMNSKLSPDELKLPTNSPLRQLFAAISNMINTAILPNASKVLLQPHIRAVACQARVFKVDDDTSTETSMKKSNIDLEMGNSFSPITKGDFHINQNSSNIEFPSVKSSE